MAQMAAYFAQSKPFHAMRYLLFLLTLLLAADPALAQNLSATTRPDSLLFAQAAPDAITETPLAAAPDTVAAIHRLFLAKRKRRIVVVAATVVVGAVGSGVLIGTASTYNITFQAVFGLSLIPATAIAGITELVCYNQYSRRQERQVIADYQNHMLPKLVRQKLKARYFQP